MKDVRDERKPCCLQRSGKEGKKAIQSAWKRNGRKESTLRGIDYHVRCQKVITIIIKIKIIIFISPQP
jgi:hypothetical protein